MGQKITEHPAVDQWVKLMRERDKAIHQFHGYDPNASYARPASSDREWEQYGEMQRARTRIVATLAPERAQLETYHLTYCLQCRTLIDDVTSPGVFHKRTTYPADSEPVRFYLCPTCAGWTGEA